VDYIFLDNDAFLEMKDREQFLECAKVYHRWYGVPRSQVQYGFEAGKDVILKVDVQGAETVRKAAPQTVSVFMAPANFDELKKRLAQRMTESSTEMELRLQTARRELERVGEFDYCVVNNDGRLDQTIRDIDAIIAAEKRRVVPRRVRLI
jgi:guanylate kinase